MFVLAALLFGLSGFLFSYYSTNTLLEKQIVKERLRRLRGSSFTASLQKNELLKSKQQDITGIWRIFRFQVLPSPGQVGSFIAFWLSGAFLVAKLAVPLFLKVVMVTLVSIAAIRFLRILALKRRQRDIRRDLPGAVDLIVICLESGLSVNAAFQRVSNEMGGSFLGREFKRTFNEINAGVPIGAALRNFGKRTDVKEVMSIVTAITQAEKMGTALAATFRVQAQSLREQYRLGIKADVMKLPVKMLFPLMFFIFPTIFILILGPAMIQVTENFANLGTQ